MSSASEGDVCYDLSTSFRPSCEFCIAYFLLVSGTLLALVLAWEDNFVISNRVGFVFRCFGEFGGWLLYDGKQVI